MAKNYDKKLMECVLLSVMKEGNTAQGKAIKSICTSPKPLFITGFAGTGKAQPLYAKILTPDGFKRMGDVKVGDQVMGADGKPQTVLGVYPQGVRPVYKVTMDDGAFTYCDEGHLWSYRIPTMDSDSSYSRCDTLKTLIEAGLDVPYKNMTLPRYSIPVCAPIEYTKKKFDINPYILGVLIGCGNLTQPTAMFSYTEDNRWILSKVASLLSNRYELTTTEYHKCIIRQNERHRGKSGSYVYKIKELGLRVKSIDKFIPESYMLGSRNQRMELLNGIMDSGGTVDSENQGAIFSTTSWSLAHNIVSLVQSLGGSAVVSDFDVPRKKYKTMYEVSIFMNDNVFSLPKLNTSNDLKITRYIESVEKVADFECVCIKVSNEDELYITDDYIVTHNTTLMKKIRPALKNAVCVAPTGVAALNMGGQTIHSFFRIGMQPYIPEIRKGAFMENCEYKFGPDNNILQSIKYLIIDEISMVRPDLLDNVADILRKARHNNEPFGGVKLIMVGDLFQLPPVIKDDFFFDIYDTQYFFSSKSLMASGMEMVSFEKIYRQNDNKFIEVLNNVRSGNMDDETLSIINNRNIDPEEGRNFIEIVTTNAKAAAVNEMRLSGINGRVARFESEVKGDYPKDAPVEKVLTVKVGSRVMLTRNDSGEGYVNGSLGTVLGLNPEYVVVLLDNPKDEEHRKVKVGRFVFEKIKYVRNGPKITSEVIGSITQFPIKIGYAITSHKCQGLTIDCAMMDISDSFETGQFYTALSRVKSLNDLYLRHPIPKKIKTSDPVVADFYKRTLEHGGIVDPVPMDVIENSMIKLSSGSEIDFSQFNL